MLAVGAATVAGGFRRGLRSDNALKFKVCFRRFSVNKISNIEEWLYHMKENGWMISIIIFNFFIFKKSEEKSDDFFIFTFSFGTKIFEVMYREDNLLEESYKGHRIPTVSFYQCFSVPQKYQLDMKDIFVRRVKIQLKFAEEKIMLYMFFLAMHTAVLIACIVEGATIIAIPAVLIILFLLLIGKNIREHRILSILIYDKK